MTVKEKLTCKDKVKDSFQNLLDDWLLASLYCGQTKEQLKEQGHDIESDDDKNWEMPDDEWDSLTKDQQGDCIEHWSEVEDYIQYDSLYDYVNQTALSWDFVKANTFNDQKIGYFRLQLSWGGPSTEFRIYTDKDLNIDHIEYWYLDWFDGASIVVEASNYYSINGKNVFDFKKLPIVVDIIEQFLEIER